MRGLDDQIEQLQRVPPGAPGEEQLAFMLRQDATHFHGLSATDVDTLRGHIFAAFEHRDVPADAVVALKEDLRTSFSPVVLAGAARAARRLIDQDADYRDLLAAASARIEVRDEIVRFPPLGGSAEPARTARGEIAATLDLYRNQPSHSCCGGRSKASASVAPKTSSLSDTVLNQVQVEDQWERRRRLASLLDGKTALIAFFYTRCMNPAKCSLTVSRLAEVARLNDIDERSRLLILGVTYDQDYDTPARLHAFGADRGFPFGERSALLRCLTGWDALRESFNLQVGYNEATVNSHARELFLVSTDRVAVGMDCERLSEPAVLLADLRSQIGPT